MVFTIGQLISVRGKVICVSGKLISVGGKWIYISGILIGTSKILIFKGGTAFVEICVCICRHLNCKRYACFFNTSEDFQKPLKNQLLREYATLHTHAK